MDKAAILEIVTLTIDDLNNASVPKMFATNRLHGLVSLLQQDDKPKAEGDGNNKVITYKGVSIPISQWIEGARRRKITCSRLRHERDEARQARDQALLERDAAREFVANRVTSDEIAEKAYSDLAAVCDARTSERNKARAGYDALAVEIVKLQKELAAAVEHCDRVCGQRNAFRDERNKASVNVFALQAERDKFAADVADLMGQRARILDDYSDLVRKNDELERCVRGGLVERDKLQASLNIARGERDASSVTIGVGSPLADRLAALEDHVELMTSQFAAFKAEANGDLDNLDDRIKVGEERLDIHRKQFDDLDTRAFKTCSRV